jgi:allantoinase
VLPPLGVVHSRSLFWSPMRRHDLILSSERVVTPTAVVPATVHVRHGVIQSIEPRGPGPLPSAAEDLGDLVLMPGIVDSHVHINEPGRSDWEGFETAGRAAAAGGITTLIDMPLNATPTTTTVDALREKTRAAAGKCLVDYGFWGGVVPDNLDQIEPLTRSGVLGFKCFLVPSGIDDFQHVAEADLRPAMARLASLGGVLLVHAESPGLIGSETDGDPREYATFLESRPPEAESEAVRMMLSLSEETGCAVHIVHVSAEQTVGLLADARRSGLNVSAETCPHYLHFCAADISAGATQFKCAPPIRDDSHREALWKALSAGSLNLVASDHSPCPPALKLSDEGDFIKAWGGISSLQLGLPVMWSEAQRRGFELTDLARWMCAGPARLTGLAGRKGAIAVGCDADMVVWDPEAEFTVRGGALQHRHKFTPYEGAKLRGTVTTTYVRGTPVFNRDTFPSECYGRWIKRGHS